MKDAKRIVHKWLWVVLLLFCFLGVIYPVIGAFALVCMLAPSAFAFFRGRKWCGFFCPRGSFNDVILSKISLKNKLPKFMKTDWFRILFLVLLMSSFAIQLILAWGSAASVGMVFVRMIIITTILTIILGFTFNHRAWCMICPMGTMAYYVSKINYSKMNSKYVTFIENKCVGCQLCTKSCPMSISVHKCKNEGKVTNEDCLKCSVCVDRCPRKALFID